jgi:hypothetical protein
LVVRAFSVKESERDVIALSWRPMRMFHLRARKHRVPALAAPILSQIGKECCAAAWNQGRKLEILLHVRRAQEAYIFLIAARRKIFLCTIRFQPEQIDSAALRSGRVRGAEGTAGL